VQCVVRIRNRGFVVEQIAAIERAVFGQIRNGAVHRIAGAYQICIRFDVATVLPLVFIRIKTRKARFMGDGRTSDRRAEVMAQQPPRSSISSRSETSRAVQARAHDRRSSHADPPRPLSL
jgi:hypothetical protein